MRRAFPWTAAHGDALGRLLWIIAARRGHGGWGYTVEPNLAYGTLPRQFVDIYRPLGPVASNRPVLVFFYGESWTSGDRGSCRFIGQSFASAGYVTVVADYRHYPEARFPGFVEDGAAAVALVARHLLSAAGHIVVIGPSSGAYIASSRLSAV
jgi:acetyl esterase/lipase